MTPERYDTIMALFYRALDAAPEERTRLLEAAGRDDPALRREVESLLEHAEAEGELHIVLPEEDPGSEPRRIGPYRLLDTLGEGGMGTVYRAEQTEPVRRTVALKLIKPGLDSRRLIARFEWERQVLAQMSHPHIARMYDAGTTEDGRPYFVMEYVPGEPITRYCDRRNLTLRARLRLFRQVCLAVEHAHRRGILHRDLKPSNVLITEEEPEPAPKVIDFGIAKATDDDPEGRTEWTEMGQLVGTPEYMSPEQVDPDQDVDTRADVYSLGLILYHLLAGALPHDARALRGGGREGLRRRLLEEDPPRPSTRAKRLVATGTSGVNRVPSPAHLKQLRGDLDWITMKALARDREARYGSAAELSADIGRYLSGDPVLAGPPGLLYRLKKLTRKHRRALAAAAIAVVGISGLLIGQRLFTDREVAGWLRRSEDALRAGEPDVAYAALERARGLRPDSYPALALEQRIETARRERIEAERRRTAFESAARDRAAARARLEDYDRLRAEHVELRGRVERERREVFSSYARRERRAALAGLERELDRLSRLLERRREEAREALERAARREAPWGGPSAETHAAFAVYFLHRWKEARATGTPAAVAAARAGVLKHDQRGDHTETLRGRGTIRVKVDSERASGEDPLKTEIHLFRYEPYESVRTEPPVVPRLVPVPTRGVGRIREGAWDEAFHPGDPCLVVTRVEPGTAAGAAGLEPGDLILRLNGEPCGDGLFVRAVSPTAPAAVRAVRALDRIESVNGEPVEKRMDWEDADADGVPDTGTRTARIAGRSYRLARDDLTAAAADALVSGDAAAATALRLSCLRGGRPLGVVIPAGAPSGITCEVTAYPLILAPGNRVRVNAAIEADPGSYLVVALRGGFAPERHPLRLPHGGSATVTIPRPGRPVPAGFVRIPAGPFLYGGDPLALNAAKRCEPSLPAFVIGRTEVTQREWFAFVNDDAVLKRIERDPDRPRFLPRSSTGEPFARTGSDGRFTWVFGGPDTPVFGVSMEDVRAYLRWRNHRAGDAGFGWEYDLPTEQEWEKAARGVDGRAFPWGDRFDFLLTQCRHRKRRPTFEAAARFEPRDESPFGVADMAGSRAEWTRSSFRPGSVDLVVRGGAWGNYDAADFRVARRFTSVPRFVHQGFGFRLVLRPR